MLHALINDAKEVLQFPLTDHAIRQMFPDTSFPVGPLDDVDLSHLNLVKVHPTRTEDLPVPDEGMKNQLHSAVWNDDQTKLVRVYVQVPRDDAQGG